MPIYLYRCRHCGNKIEIFSAINGKDSEVACPQCGNKEMTKVIMSFYDGRPRGQGGGFSFG
jgi:putative FmdB family regulatory protein